MAASIRELRRYAIARSLFAPGTLAHALDRLAFVQADPIRAPARAQDLTLRHRVRGYRVGDLERAYPELPIEEDYFVNYGFVSRRLHALMHPRTARFEWTRAERARARALLAFVRERGVVHPREVAARFAHGTTTNWFGGQSNVTTRLLDGMHYRGLLRVARRDGGVRLYAERVAVAAPADAAAAHDALIDAIVAKYAPLPAASLAQLVGHLRGGAPQWAARGRAALARAKQRLASARVDGIDWYWPAGERLHAREPEARVRLLAPFDPVVWDRRRFELFWGWAYRFEAYTPPAKRRLGYYALPLLWRDRVVGWSNLTMTDGVLRAEHGYVGEAPREAAFRRELAAELERVRTFLAGAPGLVVPRRVL